MILSANRTGGLLLLAGFFFMAGSGSAAPQTGLAKFAFAPYAKAESKKWVEKNVSPEPESKSEGRTIYGYLLAFSFNTIGFSLFLYGKKQKRTSLLIYGVLLIVYPYLLINTYAIAGVGIALCAAPILQKKFS